MSNLKNCGRRRQNEEKFEVCRKGAEVLKLAVQNIIRHAFKQFLNSFLRIPLFLESF